MRNTTIWRIKSLELPYYGQAITWGENYVLAMIGYSFGMTAAPVLLGVPAFLFMVMLIENLWGKLK